MKWHINVEIPTSPSTVIFLLIRAGARGQEVLGVEAQEVLDQGQSEGGRAWGFLSKNSNSLFIFISVFQLACGETLMLTMATVSCPHNSLNFRKGSRYFFPVSFSYFGHD